MQQLRKKVNLFLFRNRDKGIPHLMPALIVANVALYLASQFYFPLPKLFSLNTAAILQGQLWRLFTHPMTLIFYRNNLIFSAIALYFYFIMGKTIEQIWGRLKFNLFLLTGLLLTDALPLAVSLISGVDLFVEPLYLFFSLFLVVATLTPDSQVLVFFLIPVKMRWMALVHVGLTTFFLLRDFFFLYPKVPISPWLVFLLLATVPLAALLNYFLYIGRGVCVLFTGTRPRTRNYRPVAPPKASPQPTPDWAKRYRNEAGERPYRHKCTVCGRTDTDCPDLEFRYCARCAGYFCYCIDHIDNHTHIQ